jgi:penicillin amidase
LKPTYDGEIALEGISQQSTVYFDENGIPHIYASNNEDGYKVLGYVHAQDRLWQMELVRRIAPGRLSEVLGEELFSVDVFFKGIGLEDNTQKIIKTLDKSSPAYKYATAYLEGINQFIEEGDTPIEFTLLGIEKEAYDLEDVLNVYGYMAFSFAQAQKTDPFLQDIKDRLGKDYLKELEIKIDSSSTLLKNYNNNEGLVNYANAVNDILKKLPVPAFIGSNSWVIGPEKTKHGKVLFANDPHITFAQPSVWYQAHMVTPDYEMYGYHLALSPFPLLGHNRNYAYGLTMFQNDDLDFYFETENPENPNQHLTPDGYKDYVIKSKTVKVKGKPNRTFKVKHSLHGPIVNDLIETVTQEKPMAMQWAYTALENRILEVAYGISHSNSLNDFKKSASLLHAPGLNMMYGDASGNIAWFASAKLYHKRDSLDTRMVLNGASGKDEILSFIDFKDNPQAVNPKWNYVYSANNQPDSILGKFYTGYYLPYDRAERIKYLIEQKNHWDKADMQDMILDHTSLQVVDNLNFVLPILNEIASTENEKKAVEVLSKWNGDYNKQLIAPTIYYKFVNEFMKNTFADEMEEASYKAFQTTQLNKRMIGAQMAKKESVWWDNVTTDKNETKRDIVEISFKNAIAFLENQFGSDPEEWTWNKAISLEHGHALAAGGDMLKSIFNVGPFETNGGSEVINNQIFPIDDSGIYKVVGGPSTRRIIDFSDIENSMSILPTGQSGNVFSEYYDDQAEKFVNGEFVKMKMNKKEIEQSPYKLIFKP